jgi:hypothetical protein
MSRCSSKALKILCALVLLPGCEDKGKITLGTKSKADGCAASVATLADTEWVYLRANPDHSETPDPVQGRMKFFDEDGGLKVKYNVGSKSNLYEYECTSTEKEVICRETPKVKDFCQALLVGGGECTKATLRAIDSTITDAQLEKGIAEGTANVAKYKGGKDWKHFKLNNNNLGNKLQGLIYAKVDKRRCALRVTDNYMTIYKAKRIEDSNPNGTNTFVKNEVGELLWDNCTDSKNLVGRPEAGFPKNPGKVGHLARYRVGDSVHFHYLGLDGAEAPEGCSFSYDIWAEGKPVSKGLVPANAPVKIKGKTVLAWGYSKKFDAPSPPNGEIVTMVRHKTCGAKTEIAGVSCAAVLGQ